MDNPSQLWTDGICVYLRSRIRIAWYAKAVLLLMNGAFFTAIVGLFTIIPPEEMGKTLIPFTAFLIIYCLTAGRYSLWNLFGEEFLIVNTRSLSYEHGYGILQTKRVTKPFSIIAEEIDWQIEAKNDKQGTIRFWSYNEHHLPELLYEMAVRLPKERLEEFSNSLNELFQREALEGSAQSPERWN